MYKKANPTISFIDFVKLVTPVVSFSSLNGAEYVVKNIEGETLHFIRKSSGEPWSIDLTKVLQAYKELSDFKNENFRSYVPRKHSPALGLLLHVGLLKK